MAYKAILFHPDGACVSDFHKSKTIKEVWERVEDMGSRWIFYPIIVVASDNSPKKMSRIVDTAEGLEYFKKRESTTLQKYLKSEWESRKNEICDAVNEGLPWHMVYPDLPQEYTPLSAEVETGIE